MSNLNDLGNYLSVIYSKNIFLSLEKAMSIIMMLLQEHRITDLTRSIVMVHIFIYVLQYLAIVVIQDYHIVVFVVKRVTSRKSRVRPEIGHPPSRNPRCSASLR